MDYKIDDYVMVEDNVLTDDQCDMVVNYFDENEEEKGIMGPIWTADGPKVNEDIKRVKQMKIEVGIELDNLIMASCTDMINRYKKQVEFYPMSGINDDGYCLKRYQPGTDFYGWHVDSGWMNTLTRLLAVIWYVNDVDEGGETEFKWGAKVKPTKGRVLVFPANFCFPHRANVPISGPKYIINTFIFGS